MMRRYLLIIMTGLALCGCDRRETRTINGKGLRIMVQRADQPAPNTVEVQVRVLPDAALFAELNTGTKQDLMYRADSCFYLEYHGRRVYAAAVTPIANGVSGSFEYLVSFDKNQGGRLVYYDKYLNKKAYELYKQF